MSEKSHELVAVVRWALDNPSTRLPEDVLAIEGYSGKQYMRFINALLSSPTVKRYLEIGVWQGSTAVSALYENITKVKHFLIDNFSQTFGNNAKDRLCDNFRKYLSVLPNLIERDCFGIDPATYGIGDIDVYFYDGQHSEKDHFMSLKHFLSAMSKTFVFIVDDWNWDFVRKGTLDAMIDSGVEVLFKKEIRTEYEQDKEGWWNGCCVFVLRRNP